MSDEKQQPWKATDLAALTNEWEIFLSYGHILYTSYLGNALSLVTKTRVFRWYHQLPDGTVQECYEDVFRSRSYRNLKGNEAKAWWVSQIPLIERAGIFSPAGESLLGPLAVESSLLHELSLKVEPCHNHPDYSTVQPIQIQGRAHTLEVWQLYARLPNQEATVSCWLTSETNAPKALRPLLREPCDATFDLKRRLILVEAAVLGRPEYLRGTWAEKPKIYISNSKPKQYRLSVRVTQVYEGVGPPVDLASDVDLRLTNQHTNEENLQLMLPHFAAEEDKQGDGPLDTPVDNKRPLKKSKKDNPLP